MVRLALKFKAELEGITNLRPVGDDFRWYLKLRCGSCGDETPDYVYCTQAESVPIPGGRGHANLVVKCKFCKRDNSVDIMHDTLAPYNAEDAGKPKTIVVFDCRGVEITDYSPRVGWSAEGEETNTPFPDIDLSEKEWYDVDDKTNTPVSVTEMEFSFEKFHGK